MSDISYAGVGGAGQPAWFPLGRRPAVMELVNSEQGGAGDLVAAPGKFWFVNNRELFRVSYITFTANRPLSHIYHWKDPGFSRFPLALRMVQSSVPEGVYAP